MLKARIDTPYKTVALPSLHKGDPAATMTDYTKPGTEILRWRQNDDGTGTIEKSKRGISQEIGKYRAIIPLEGWTHIKTLQPGDRFELPFKSKFGVAVLIFDLE